MDEAEQILRKGDVEKVAEDWRMRTYLLAEALYQSVHMQLDLVRYRAIGVDRGATLASAENPLNNRRWLRAQFERIRALPDEAARLKELQAIVDWTDPGPGGFYDDLGNAQLQPHLVRGVAVRRGSGPVSLRRDGLRLSSGMAIVLGDARRIVLRCPADAEVSGARRVRALQAARRSTRATRSARRRFGSSRMARRRSRRSRRSRIRWRRWSSTFRRRRPPAAR